MAGMTARVPEALGLALEAIDDLKGQRPVVPGPSRIE